jgi:hypothetical protein
MAGCGCGGSGPDDPNNLYEARTVGGQTLEVAPGRTQGTRNEAMTAAKTQNGTFLVKV